MYDAARDSDPLLARRGRSMTRSTFTLAHVLLACGAACACAVFATVTILHASTGDARGLALVGDVDASDAYALGFKRPLSKKIAKRQLQAQLEKVKSTLEDVKADLKECKARMDANDDDAALGGFKKTYSKAKNAVTDAVSDAKDVKERLKEMASALKECKAKLDEKKADDAAALGGFFKKASKKAKKASKKAKKAASKVKDAAVDVKDAVTDAASDAKDTAKDVKAKLEQAAKDLKECTAQLADKDYSADY